MKNDTPVKPAEVPIRTLENSLPIQLLKVHHQVMAYFRPMLHHFGMTDQQWRVLRAVAAGVSDFGELAEACHIQPASLSRMLITLQDKGWTTREVSDSDRRQRNVTMTKEGWILFHAASAETEKIYAELEADLGGDYTQMIETIATFSKKLAQTV